MNLYETIGEILRKKLPHAKEREVQGIMNQLKRLLAKDEIELSKEETEPNKNVPFFLYRWLKDNWKTSVLVEIYDYVANEIRILKLHTKKADNQSKDVSESDVVECSNDLMNQLLGMIRREYLSEEDMQIFPRQEYFEKTLQKYNISSMSQREHFNAEIQKHFDNPNLLFAFEKGDIGITVNPANRMTEDFFRITKY